MVKLFATVFLMSLKGDAELEAYTYCSRMIVAEAGRYGYCNEIATVFILFDHFIQYGS